jgi:hypothetical protein
MATLEELKQLMWAAESAVVKAENRGATFRTLERLDRKRDEAHDAYLTKLGEVHGEETFEEKIERLSHQANQPAEQPTAAEPPSTSKALFSFNLTFLVKPLVDPKS